MLPSQAWAHCPSSCPGSPGPRTPSPARPSTANTATRNTSAWAPSRCTSEATRCPASVAPAGRPSPGPGCSKGMSGPTPGRSPSPARTAAAPSPTAPTCGPTCRPTRTSRSTSARPVPAPSPACPCSTSTKSLAAQGAPADPPRLPPPLQTLPMQWPPPSSGRKDPCILLSAMEFPSEPPCLAALAPWTLRTTFQLCLLWGLSWLCRQLLGGWPLCSHCSPHSGVGLSAWACVSKLFGYGCFELQDKSQQTDRRLLPHSGDLAPPHPRNPQATSPGGASNCNNPPPGAPTGVRGGRWLRTV